MKKMINSGIVAILIAFAFSSCTKNVGTSGTSGKLSLKQSVDQSTANLNLAVKEISSSPAFGILTVNDGSLKSGTVTDSTYRVNIGLDLIKGIYDYKPSVRRDRRGGSILHFFTKTADSNDMIVRMPLQKARNPFALRYYLRSDSTLSNNFAIDVSDYHNYYNSYRNCDYLLASTISTDSVETGNLNIQSTVNPSTGVHYSAEFGFTDSYTAQYQYDSGDTTVSSFTIKDNSNVVYEEKLLTIRNDTVRFGREFQYILTIGNVQIVKNSVTRTTQVYVDGTLQSNATIQVVDATSDSEPSVCKKRDVQITFEDGSTATISSLIGQSVSDIKTIYTSLHHVFFAANIVDWIAYDIYYQSSI